MVFGTISPEAQAEITRYVQGQAVLDVMAGGGELADQLLSFGAEHVWAVDKEFAAPKRKSPRLRWTQSYLVDFVREHSAEGLPRIGFLSWPVFHTTPGLIDLISRLETVIYLGVNDSFSACGSREFWEHVAHREVLCQVLGDQDVIVYGARLPHSREDHDLLSHEIAAFQAHNWTSNLAPRKQT